MLDFLVIAYKDSPTFVLILEFVCFVLGIMSVWYARKQNILVYPTGLISTTIVVYLLYISKDLGNMVVNFYFSIMSLYGWYNWKFKKTENRSALKITNATFKEKLIGLCVAIFTFLLVYTIYKYFEMKIDVFAYIDLITTSVFFTAMWYMANKKLENWMLWIFANIIVVPLYAYRGFTLLALQYLILTIIAILAYRDWKKEVLNKNG